MGFLDKAKDLAGKHEDKTSSALDKGADLLDQKTGGKHTEHIETGQRHAGEALGLDPDAEGRGPAGEPGGAAVEGAGEDVAGTPGGPGSDDQGLARHERPGGSDTQSRDLGRHEAP